MVQLQVGKGLRMGASFPWKWISSMFPMSGWEEGGGSNSSPRSVVFWCLCVCVSVCRQRGGMVWGALMMSNHVYPVCVCVCVCVCV